MIRRTDYGGASPIYDTTIYVTLAWANDERTDLGQVNIFFQEDGAHEWQEDWGGKIGPVDIYPTRVFLDVRSGVIKLTEEAKKNPVERSAYGPGTSYVFGQSLEDVVVAVVEATLSDR